MTTANDRQVGGSHYQTGGTQHWDLFGPEYLVGCATKYVSRWRKKNGIEDLKKAKHFAEKLLEIAQVNENMWSVGIGALFEWSEKIGLDWVEMQIVRRLVYWSSEGDIQTAIEGIDYLIDSHTKVPSLTWGPVIQPVGSFYGPGTPEDGGHHARQPHD